MTGESALQRARALLMEVTPLLTDCGKICGGVCCHPDLGEVTGMLLFPGRTRITGICPAIRCYPRITARC